MATWLGEWQPCWGSGNLVGGEATWLGEWQPGWGSGNLVGGVATWLGRGNLVGGVATWLARGWAVSDCRGELLQPFTSLSDDGIKEGLPHGGVPPVVGLLRIGIMYNI